MLLDLTLRPSLRERARDIAQARTTPSFNLELELLVVVSPETSNRHRYDGMVRKRHVFQPGGSSRCMLAFFGWEAGRS